MNPLRQRLVDWLFGFGEPVEDDYVPPAPAPSMVTVPVTDLAPVEEPGATLPDLSVSGASSASSHSASPRPTTSARTPASTSG
jgi:hypothetical protein